MGVDSGLPDFRGPQGFWRAYPVFRGRRFEEISNPVWFRTDPEQAWGFFGHRLNLYRTTPPHAGFQNPAANGVRGGGRAISSLRATWTGISSGPDLIPIASWRVPRLDPFLAVRQSLLGRDRNGRSNHGQRGRSDRPCPAAPAPLPPLRRSGPA